MLRLPCAGASEQTTTNTIFAAAFAAIGVMVHTHRTHDLQTGEDGASFTLGDVSVLYPQMQTQALHWGLKRGTLESADPTHPILDAVRALRNRSALVKWIRNAQPHHLRFTGTRAQYSPGADQVTFVADGQPTSDLHLVSALATIGVPIVRFTGTAPHHLFYLPARGIEIAGASIDVTALRRTLADGTLAQLEPNHPIHIGLRACREFDNLKRLMQSECVMLRLDDTKYQSQRTAIIRADAINSAYDGSRSWFARAKR